MPELIREPGRSADRLYNTTTTITIPGCQQHAARWRRIHVANTLTITGWAVGVCCQNSSTHSVTENDGWRTCYG